MCSAPNDQATNAGAASVDSAGISEPKDSCADRQPPAAHATIVIGENCARAAGAVCERCALACPHDAIDLPPAGTGIPRIDAARCSACGICHGICDAFGSTRLTLKDAAARALRAAGHGDAVYVTCQELVPDGADPAANTVVLPCLAAGPPEFWTLALTAQTPLVAACDLAKCSDCAKAGSLAIDLFEHAIETAQAWTGRHVGFSEEPPLKRTLVQEYSRNETLDRRGVLRKALLDVTESASGTRRVKTSSVLQDFQERTERLHATMRLSAHDEARFQGLRAHGRPKPRLLPRRSMLLEAAERSEVVASRATVTVSRTDRQRCRLDRACVSACPVHARIVQDDGSVRTDERLCAGCGACACACGADAIEFYETTLESVLPNDRPPL